MCGHTSADQDNSFYVFRSQTQDIAVVGVPDDTWGEVGYAFVISKPGADLKAEDLIRFCDGQLAHYKWPKQILFA